MTLARPGASPPEQPLAPGWGQSLASGAAGLAMLHVGYARVGLGDWTTAHKWVTAMTAEPVAAHTNACLFRGAPAVAFVLRTANVPAYDGGLHTLDDHVTVITRARLKTAHERIDRAVLPDLREFDLINGLTGLGVYLLQATHSDHARALLRDVLTYLIRLTGQITVEGVTLPGWWTANGPSDLPDPRWPGGHANLGMAHGVAGPLALLSAAMINGVTVPGQAEAIDLIDCFLDSWRYGPQQSSWWPGMISAREWTNATIEQAGPQRPSWCYGTPGLARARHLAAQALDAPSEMGNATAALVACITDDAQLALLDDDSLCHGFAGLVHTSRRMLANAEPGSESAEALSRLEHLWRQRRQQTVPELSDPSGMLEGNAGIALTDLPAEIGWDTCLLTIPATTTPIHATAHIEGIR
jgi:lantibiotic biosynthesis protein